MSGAQEQNILGAADAAKRAGSNARGTAAPDSEPSHIRMAEVTAVSGAVATVTVLGSDGLTAYTVEGCRTLNNATVSVGDVVLAVYIGDSPLPVIVTASGGGDGSSLFFGQFAGMLAG